MTYPAAKQWSAVIVLVMSAVCFARAESTWRSTEWNGERAFVAESEGYAAIVSVDRARLVHLGRVADGKNILFAPSERGRSTEWGGHRLWLGPQTDWARNWPPPIAWEMSAPESVEVAGGELVLKLHDAGDGWPRLVRTYAWREGRFVCGARLSGGARPAQVIHVLQVLADAKVRVTATPTASVPHGYVQLHLGRGLLKQFDAPPHVVGRSGSLELRFAGITEKLGFAAQPLEARIGDIELRVGRGAITGRIVTTPDEGFVTQVYFSGPRVPLIELEQLSPTFEVGADASFEMILEVAGTSD